MAQKFIELRNKKTGESALFQHFGYDYHVQLESEYKRKFGQDWLAVGGGWWFKDDNKKVMFYYSRSHAFGRFDEDLVKELAEQRLKEKNLDYKVASYSGVELDEAFMIYSTENE